MSNVAYHEFLARKAITDPPTGLDVIPDLPERLFPFQHDIVSWALRRGRAALFAGTGLGKSFMELAWADAVHRETGKDILHLAPLAVTAQMVREADKFGIAARQVRDQAGCLAGTNITNYQKLDHFDLSKFGGVILDESSILKSYDGHYRTKLIQACAHIPFRLAATATPAPNDYMELGNHAEFLGIMSYTDMLATFFTHDGSETQKWRLKGHAEQEFWKWMASWAVMLRKPSDLGYANEGYDLPPLNQMQHIVAADYAPNIDTGTLFPMQAANLQERLRARRGSISGRVQEAVDIVLARYRGLTECAAAKNVSNIIEPTTAPTNTSTTNAPQNSASDTTLSDVSNTPPTQPLQKKQKNTRASDPKKSAETSGFNLGTELPRVNITTSSAASPTSAQYVGEQARIADASMLTIATKLALSEACSAEIATTGSGGLPTVRTVWRAQSSTFGNLVVEPWVIWCHLNDEQDALKIALGDLAISISGAHSDEEKEKLHQDWLDGKAPVLITKCTIFGYGMNWQHCSQTTFVGLNGSFEQIYQAIRRFWRFGQTKPVNVHFIASEIEGAVVADIKRKEADADRMAAAMVLHMADLSSQIVRGSVRDKGQYHPTDPVRLPDWLGDAA